MKNTITSFNSKKLGDDVMRLSAIALGNKF
jgi:hypothetical protein